MEAGKTQLGVRRWLAVASLLAALAFVPPSRAQTLTNVPPVQIDDSNYYYINTSLDNGNVDAWVGGYYNGNCSLLIQSSGSLFNVVYGYVGSYYGNNQVTVTGGNWANSADLVLGVYSDSNSLIIQNAGTVSSDYGYIGGSDQTHNTGHFPGSDSSGGNNNTVLVTGTNSSWTTTQDLTVGWSFGATNNSLTVNNSATVTVGGYMNVGYLGSGSSLIISGGGQVTSSLGGIVGANNSAAPVGYLGTVDNNSVLVTGSGSAWNAGSSLFVGNCTGTNNNLTISDGGVVHDGDGAIGFDVLTGNYAANNDWVHVTGSNSVWNNSGDLYVGGYGFGNSLVIENGGQVLNGNSTYGAVIGFDDNAGVANNNTVLVTGSGSLWNNSSDLYVGYYSSSNNLTVANGGVVINVNGYIGYDGKFGGGLGNSVVVTGSGSTWSNTADVTLGNANGSSSNSLVIASGGQVFNVNATIGNDTAASNNLVQVTGTGSIWNNSGDLYIGGNGSFNSLTVDTGGQVNNGGGFIGWGASANGNAVLVTGSGSLWTNGGDLNLGFYGGTSNSLVIANGGRVFNNNGNIGGAPLGSPANFNSVLVTNAGSVWVNNGDLSLGYNGGVSNSLTIASGGQVFNNNGAIGEGNAGLGYGTGNWVTVTGSGSLWNNRSNLWVGRGWNNQLTIAAGGTVSNQNGSVGYDTNANYNAVTVTGSGSLWANSGTLYVGLTGSFNQVTLSNSGRMFSATGYIGYDVLAISNIVLVTDPGSRWSNSGALYVGGTGAFNQLIITNAGVVLSGSGYIGYNALASNNAVLVTGAGSVWSNSGSLVVGLTSAGNQLILTNGGTVRTLGSFTLGTNAALLNNAGGSLYVGGNFDNQATNQSASDFSGTAVFNGGGALQTVEVAGVYAVAGLGRATNFYFGTFQVGDTVTGSNAWVRLVDNRANIAGAGNETLGASNVIVALASSVLDLNNRTSFVWHLSNTGTILQTNASPSGVITRLDVVNTFTNAGTILVGNGSVLQFSNAFVNSGTLRFFGGGVLTNFVAGNVLTNSGSVTGNGVLAVLVNNTGSITATGGILRLTVGFANNTFNTGPVNAGLLLALGAGAELYVVQSFTNLGSIVGTNAAFVGQGVVNRNLVRMDSQSSAVFNGTVNNDAGATIQALNGSSFDINDAVTNAGAITAQSQSAMVFTGSVYNAAGGTVTVQDQSTATFAGAVTNAGTITVQNQSVLTFNGGLTNNGTLAFGPVVNPSTAIITGSLTLGISGVIWMRNTNDILVLQGNFVNGSTNSAGFNTTNSVVVFGAAGPLTTNTFEVAGRNVGTNFGGFINNFAVGTLNVTNGIRFVDYVDNGGGGNSNEVLYVDVLHLFSGSTMKLSALTIYVGMQFIDDDGTGAKTFTSGTIDQSNAASLGLVNVFIDNGGQIVFVPEPSTYALLLAGAAAMGWWRRRRAGPA
jgi:fibronectin-binding autotransporter adhesin